MSVETKLRSELAQSDQAYRNCSETLASAVEECLTLEAKLIEARDFIENTTGAKFKSDAWWLIQQINDVLGQATHPDFEKEKTKH